MQGKDLNRFAVQERHAAAEMRQGRRRFALVNTTAILAMGILPVSILTTITFSAAEAESVFWWIFLMSGLAGSTVAFSRVAHPYLVRIGKGWKQILPFLAGAVLTAFVMSLLTALYFSFVTFGFEAHEKEAVIVMVPALWLGAGCFAAVVLLVLDLVLLRTYLGFRDRPS